MKICPDCQARYGDDVDVCPKDGEDLVDLPEELSGNPKLAQPKAAGAQDRTSMIDLEAIEAKRAAKKAAKAAERGEVVDEEKTPPPEGPLEEDVDATGTLHKKKDKTKTKMSKVQERVASDDVVESSVDVGADADDLPSDRRVNEDETDRDMTGRSKRGSKLSRADQSAMRKIDGGTATGMKGGTRTGMKGGTRAGTQMKEPPRKKSLSGTQAAFLVVFAVVALIGGIVFVARATAVLTVTTVPPGATVMLDAKSIGASPLQKRVRTGEHVIELSLDGYEPFKEVVDVPAGGLPFLQPMQKKPPPPPPPPKPEEIAQDMNRAAEMMYQGGDPEGAKAKEYEALKVFPACTACAALIKKINDEQAKKGAAAAKEEEAAARNERLGKARVLAEEGRRLYESNQLGPAKEKLYASLKLDASNPEPHRTLGRIFNREDEVEKVRYHLQRYLDLGGSDGDFKVREWIRSHPK